MAIEQTNVVDAIGIERDTGVTVLTIVDALDWEATDQHLSFLRDKLRAYQSFVGSGELLERYPKACGRPVRVDIVFQFDPPPAATNLLAAVGRSWADLPLPIAWRVHPGG